MDYLWTPWRYRYISEAAHESVCVFCRVLALGDDASALIVLRGRKNFVILNRFPYGSGHCMVVPFAHVPGLAGCDPETLTEMMELTRRVQSALEGLYHPQGYNIGMNLGRAAGAGVADHIHLHILPRWFGDTNFMTTLAETRLAPEALEVTYTKLHGALATSP
ncbi:MAG TPA: HIT domain-containing protein [Candidatus Dormibacteraeota bacterium]|nr:HIT domain-containing protein [Candidatus Dormibacteraeota bacterium]